MRNKYIILLFALSLQSHGDVITEYNSAYKEYAHKLKTLFQKRNTLKNNTVNTKLEKGELLGRVFSSLGQSGKKTIEEGKNWIQKYQSKEAVQAQKIENKTEVLSSSDNSQYTRRSVGSRLRFPINKRVLFSSQNCNQVINNKYYEACYNYNYKASKYINYTLEGDLVYKLNIEKRPKFYEERKIPRQYRATYRDFSHTDYDRGHSLSDSSADYSMESLNSTYSLVNIWAMASVVNRKTWIKAEKYSRKIAKKLGRVSVLNIADIPENPIRIGRNQIAVPYGFYKIIYNEEKNFRRCFYYENDKQASPEDDRLKNHLISCDEIYLRQGV